MKSFTGKRVLMLLENCSYPRDIRVRYEAEALIESGYQVSVVCQRGINEPWQEVVNGVYVYRYPAPPQASGILGYFLEYSYSFLATFFLSLFVAVRRGFDIIHAANPPDTAVFIALFYKPFGKQFVFDQHDLVPEMYLVRSQDTGSRFFYKMLVWMEKLSYRFAQHIIATNQSYKNTAMQRGKVSEDKITIVRNGPDLDRLQWVERNTVVEKASVYHIGYLGVMGPQDGLDYLLRVLHVLITQLGRSNIFCVLIGSGSVIDDLKNLTCQLGLDPFVSFTGFLPYSDAMRCLSTVDICVDPDPSNIYNDRCTMVKMMEYMALGKPIVAFDLPEHRVTAGDAALYARPNDEFDFASKIAVLMDDPELRKKMGEIGRQRVEQELAWTHQKVHLIKAYAALNPD